MTQTIRWLSALVLLLSVGGVAVRAEEEEAPPPGRRTVELLPAPRPVAVDPCAPRLYWPSTAPGVFSFPSPCPVPAPCPLAPFLAPCGDGCGACAACSCPNCPLCSTAQAAEGAEYVVDMKVVRGGDGDDHVMACPRVSVLENQTAIVEVNGVETPKDQCSLQMQATVTPSWTNGGVLLDLCVTDSCAHRGGAGLKAHTEMTETRLPVSLGKATKLELTHDSDGACTSWVEVKVTEVEREALAPKTTAAGSCPKSAVYEEEEDAEGCGLADFIGAVQDLFGLAADTASSMSGLDTPAEPAAQLAGQYLQSPPEYCPPPCPAACATPCHGCGTCPVASAGGGCTQCVAVESAKQPAVQVSIDASNERKCVEMTDGKKHFKATADHLTMHDGCIELQGDVRAESCDDSCNDCTVIKADRMRVERKDGGLKIDVEGPTAPTGNVPYYFFNDSGR